MDVMFKYLEFVHILLSPVVERFWCAQLLLLLLWLLLWLE
jgi:hypothetical protein